MKLTVKNLDLSYGASQALYSINLEASSGQITSVLGRNGVGKTSLAKALVGRKMSYSGEIRWNGLDVSNVGPAERAHIGMSYVPQGREIFARLTVQENLETGFAALTREFRFIPPEIFDLFPVRKTMLDRRGGDLSGGQQQQLAIARSLVTRPKLLVLDEPTEGIQPSIIKDIGKVLISLRDDKEIAILLVEQYLDFALSLSDRVYVLDRGQVKIAGLIHEIDPLEVRSHIAV